MKELDRFISRRKFLGQASCAGLGYATFMNSLLNLKAINASAISDSSNNGYKAMICILQAGGNDSFNMLIPRSNARYGEYQSARSNLAIPQNDLLPLYPTVSDGHQYGLHPSMTGVQNLFNNNKVSFLSNVGTLMDHTTKTTYENNPNSLPLGLFSHADQIQQWQTSIKDQRTAVGWAGKIADLIGDQNNNQNISMNISLSGTNLFQTGNNTIEYALDPFEGAIGINGYDPQSDWIFEQVRTQGVNSLMEHTYQDIFKKKYAETIINAKDAHAEFSDAANTFSGFNNAQFSDNYFSKSLEQIAKTIAIRDTLGFQRQIFYVTFGGWDHHDEVLENQSAMLGMLSDGLVELNQALEELGVSNDVLTYTISEFGRTLTSNGNGTDHAWGGNVMMMGGTNLINGKTIFGNYPSLTLDNNLDVGGGVFIPTTSTDSYFAEIAKWFGVPNSDLSTIFPQIGNFYNTNSSQMPIGFIK